MKTKTILSAFVFVCCASLAVVYHYSTFLAAWAIANGIALELGQ